MKLSCFHTKIQPLPYYLLTRSLLLTCVLLCASAVLLLFAGGRSFSTVLLYEYADHLLASALITFAAGLTGAPLLEDVLRNTR